MRKSAVLAVGAAIVVGGCLGFGYWNHRPAFLFGEASAAPTADAGSGKAVTGSTKGRRGGGAISVVVATAEAGELPVRRSTIGWIASTAATTITTQQQGIVTALLATNGQEVKAGDLLLQLDDRAPAATLDRDQAALARDQATLVSAKADLDRTQGLFDRKIDSQQQMDQATAVSMSDAAVVSLDQANIKADQVVVDEMKIKAPHDGRLGAFGVTVGSLVSPGSAIVTLTDVDHIEAVFTVSDADVPLLRQTLAQGPVTVHIASADPGSATAGPPPKAGVAAAANVSAQLDFLDSAIAQGSGTLSVRAAVPNTDRLFWPGQAVKVDVDLGTNRNIVIVPTVAVQQGQSGSNIFVVKPDKTIDVRPVTVAGIVGDKAGLSSGVEAGDLVVTEGQLSLAQGMAVSVRGKEAAPAKSPGSVAPKTGTAGGAS